MISIMLIDPFHVFAVIMFSTIGNNFHPVLAYYRLKFILRVRKQELSNPNRETFNTIIINNLMGKVDVRNVVNVSKRKMRCC